MRGFWQVIRTHVDLRDVHAYLGIALIAAGLAVVWWPAALIVTGALLLYLALRRVA